MTWATVVVASVGCYLLKLAGLLLPAGWFAAPRAQRLTALIPVALLAAIIARQTFAGGHRLVVDARLAGVAVAVLAVRRRLPFPVVVIGAAVTTALLRLTTSS